MRTSRKYTTELYNQFRYYAAWLPGTPFRLGDVGILQGKEFIRKTNLSDLGIPFDILEDTTRATISHTSSGSVSIVAKAAGTAPALGSTLTQAKAGISVSFTKENSVLVKALGTLNHSIKDQVALGKEILTRYDAKQWDKDFLVITELVVADSSTILISSSSESKIELSAEADVSIAQLDLAGTEVKLGTTISKDLSTEIIAEKGLTPLFKLSKIQTPFLQDRIFETTKMRGNTASTQVGINLENDFFGEFYED